ncbi:hypothetical protein HUU61_10095 [Rhodopseudomonas palustris]|nr:hypothetical protein [Rhodopseudomonas palustris]
MQYLNSLIELAKAIAWPASIVWAAWYFRDPLIAQLPRITKVGPVTLDPPPTQIAIPTTSSADDITKEITGYISQDLIAEGRQIIDEKVPTQVDKTAEISSLRTVAAGFMIAGLFERLNGIIFGSQLILLQLANSAPVNIEGAREQYERAALLFSTTYVNYTFEQWLNFLENSALLKKESDGLLHITKRGRGFLSYLVQNGHPMARVN